MDINTKLLEGCGTLSQTFYVMYLELEINFLEATRSRDRERERALLLYSVSHFVYYINVCTTDTYMYGPG